MKILYLDLGNTRLKYWLTENGAITEQMAVQHLQAPAELLIGLEDRLDRFSPEFIGVSSVLGKKLGKRLAHQLKKHGIDFEFVHVDAAHPAMRSNYDASQLGVDRWLQMLSVADASKKLCVVGCGTALTIDLIDQARHLGGYIFPSIYLQRESLQSGTRQIRIPDAEFSSIDTGTTTSDAVHRGIMLSIVGAIHHIINQYPDFELILTGGDAKIIAQHIRPNSTIYDNLVLSGMQRYFSKKILSRT